MKAILNFSGCIILCLLSLTIPARSQEVPIRELTVDQNNIATIEVQSKEDFYYVLKVRNSLHEPFDHFSAMSLGKNGIVKLKESIGKYPITHYQVLEYRKSQPSDCDGDGIDDVKEFLNPVNQSPFNAAKQINFKDGAVQIPDRDVFRELSYQGEGIDHIDSHLKGLEFIKFYIVGDDQQRTTVR